MQYNKRNFGERTNALTLSPYFDDFGSSSPQPIEDLFLQTEALEFIKTEDDTFIIAEQLGV